MTLGRPVYFYRTDLMEQLIPKTPAEGMAYLRDLL
jgi:hypothetical protein